MKKVAFFVDGNFLFHQVKNLKSFFCDGPNIKAYCERHLRADERIYRIFYCPTQGGVKPPPLGGGFSVSFVVCGHEQLS